MFWLVLFVIIAFAIGFWFGWRLSTDAAREEIELMMDYVDRDMIHSAASLECIKTRLGRKIQRLIVAQVRLMAENSYLFRKLEEIDVERARMYISRAKEALIVRKERIEDAVSDFEGTAHATAGFADEIIENLRGISDDIHTIEGLDDGVDKLKNIKKKLKAATAYAEVVSKSMENLGRDITVVSSIANATRDAVIESLDEARKLLGDK